MLVTVTISSGYVGSPAYEGKKNILDSKSGKGIISAIGDFWLCKHRCNFKSIIVCFANVHFSKHFKKV